MGVSRWRGGSRPLPGDLVDRLLVGPDGGDDARQDGGFALEWNQYSHDIKGKVHGIDSFCFFVERVDVVIGFVAESPKIMEFRARTLNIGVARILKPRPEVA